MLKKKILNGVAAMQHPAGELARIRDFSGIRKDSY